MALTDKIVAIADKTRELTGITEKMTLDEIPSKMDEIKTNPILQDKAIEIIENGTTNIVADEGYDGLNNVEVITNVASGGGEVPKVGFVVNNWDSAGYPTDITCIGQQVIDMYMFYTNTNGGMFKNLSNLTIPNGVVNLGNYSLYGLKKLVSINLPNTLVVIGDSAFYNDNNLVLSNLPDSVTNISDNAFQYCSNLNLNKFPSELNSIGANAFGTSKVPITELPNKLVTIGYFAFSSNSYVAIKRIPESVQNIYYGAFYNNSGITQISVDVSNLSGNSASQSGRGVFQDCRNMIACWVGSKITNLYQYSFNGNTSMKKLYIDKSRATVEAFNGYSTHFSNNTNTTFEIICNDDEDWMTREEFDAIDWSTYEE